MVRHINAVALACLPALILILSAAPGSCPSGSCNEDLSVPTVSVVETLQ